MGSWSGLPFSVSSAIIKEKMSDDFFTQRQDIEHQLDQHSAFLRGKSIFCNCDDWRTSHFFGYFRDNFAKLGLNRLVTTSLDGHYSVTTREGFTHTTIADGDFRKTTNLLAECDVVVTNPPFSLMREYLRLLRRYHKDFCVMGCLSAMSGPDAKAMLISGEMTVRKTRKSTTTFIVADPEGKEHIDASGVKYMTLGNICWFTTLPTPRGKCDSPWESVSTHKQPYDNYDAININSLKDIPPDYTGKMGVPVTFLYKHNPEVFRLLDVVNGLKVKGKAIYVRAIVQRV